MGEGRRGDSESECHLNVFFLAFYPTKATPGPLRLGSLHHQRLTVMKSRSDAEEAEDGAHLKRWRFP